MKKIIVLNVLAIVISFMLSCSSAPKRPMEVTAIQTNANIALESGNTNIQSGNYVQAKTFLDTAFNYAMSIDSNDLLTSISLAKVSLALSYDPPQIDNANNYLSEAQVFSKYSNNSQKLSALCVLSSIRIQLADSNTDDYSGFLEKLEENRKFLKSDIYNEAHFLSVQGDIYRLLKNYTEAEKVFVETAKMYTENRYLTEIGLAWYKVAQVRSLAGKKQPCLEALDKAIFYDKAAENTKALGTDYYIKAIVTLKDNPTEKDKIDANYYFIHSADIFEAAGFPDLAERSRKMVKN